MERLQHNCCMFFVNTDFFAVHLVILSWQLSVKYGLDGTNPCTNTAALEDNPKTYAALAANVLGADYRIVAWSGKGLVRNIGYAPLMPELYTRYGANDVDNSYTFPADWTPDAVGHQPWYERLWLPWI